MTDPWVALVLAGGASSRLGGVDKPLLTVGGITLLERAVAAVDAAGAERVIIVGPRRERGVRPGVTFVEESPPGSGPAAAVVAGARAVDGDPIVLVMAADLPRAGSLVPAVVAAARRAVGEGRDGAMARAGGRDQYLLHAVRRGALLDAVATVDLRNGSMRQMVELLTLDRVDVPLDDVVDTDTWEAVSEARRELSLGGPMRMREWSVQATAIAGVEGAPIDIDAILDLARDAAHGVERPAAPVTAFILGYAAATQGLDAAGVAELAAKLGTAALEVGSSGASARG